MKTMPYCSYAFIPQCQTINHAYYVRMREALRRKERKLWPNDWILHHDNAPSRKALSLEQFLTQKSISERENPP
jgi:hypothetical protein